MEIINANATYAADIANIEKVCFSHPWNENDICDSLKNDTVFFIAFFDKSAAGYCGMQITADAGYITNVAVLPDFRKRGAARALLEKLREYAKMLNLREISLEVRRSNFAAISLYEKCGYVPLGERKNFYRDPRENAVIMTLYL